MSEYEPAPPPRERIEDDDAAFDRWRHENPEEWDEMLGGRLPRLPGEKPA